MVRYRMGTSEEAAEFERDFPNLYFRIVQVSDRLTAHFLRGSLECLVSLSHNKDAEPRIVEAVFDETLAAGYEASMRKFFATNKNKKSSALPRPQFPVQFAIEMGDTQEPFDFPFQNYGDALLKDFCKKVEQRTLYLFRHRFSRRK